MNLSFSLKCVLPDPCKILGLYVLIYIYRVQGNNWALVQWAYQIKGEDKTMGPLPVNIKSSHKWYVINMHNLWFVLTGIELLWFILTRREHLLSFIF